MYAENYAFTIRVTNEDDALWDEKEFTLQVFSTPVILTQTLTDGRINQPYNDAILVNGSKPLTWDLSQGSLPAGLTLVLSTGLITGTPVAAGSATFTVRVKNVLGEDARE